MQQMFGSVSSFSFYTQGEKSPVKIYKCLIISIVMGKIFTRKYSNMNKLKFLQFSDKLYKC